MFQILKDQNAVYGIKSANHKPLLTKLGFVFLDTLRCTILILCLIVDYSAQENGNAEVMLWTISPDQSVP